MKHLFLIALLFSLAACGFQPLYGTGGARKAVAPQLAQVHVPIIYDAQGQQFRNALLDRMPPPAATQRYQLNVGLLETKVGIAISRDATVTRQQLRTNATANLMDRSNNQIVWKQEIFATSGYNVLGSQFSTLVGEEDARKRNLEDLSERLTGMLALYFERGPENRPVNNHVTIAPAAALPDAVSTFQTVR